MYISKMFLLESTSNSTSAEKLAASIWSRSSPVNLLRRESHEYGILGKNVEKFSYQCNGRR